MLKVIFGFLALCVVTVAFKVRAVAKERTGLESVSEGVHLLWTVDRAVKPVLERTDCSTPQAPACFEALVSLFVDEMNSGRSLVYKLKTYEVFQKHLNTIKDQESGETHAANDSVEKLIGETNLRGAFLVHLQNHHVMLPGEVELKEKTRAHYEAEYCTAIPQAAAEVLAMQTTLRPEQKDRMGSSTLEATRLCGVMVAPPVFSAEAAPAPGTTTVTEAGN